MKVEKGSRFKETKSTEFQRKAEPPERRRDQQLFHLGPFPGWVQTAGPALRTGRAGWQKGL